MRDREYDIAFLEIKIRNDELVREWLLHKLGRRAEVLSASILGRETEGHRRGDTEAANAQSYS